MKPYFLIALFSIFSFGFSQEKINVGDFSSLEVFDKISVNLVPSNQNFIEISGNNAESVQYVNKNNSLKIRMKIDQFLQGDQTRVTVYYKNLNSIYASEGSKITSDDAVKATSLILNSKEGAKIDLAIASTNLDVTANSGGYITTSGKTTTQTVNCNAGAVYEGENLKSKTTTVAVNAGGEAKVFASEYVNAKTRAGGNIHIFGGAEVDKKTLAGGKIHIH